MEVYYYNNNNCIISYILLFICTPKVTPVTMTAKTV